MKKTSKKLFAILMVILMLLNYIPVISVAASSATLALESTASKYNVGDEILVDVKATEIIDAGAVKQLKTIVEYDETALELVDKIVTESGYSSQGEATSSTVVISTALATGSIEVNDVIFTLKFRALKSSDTSTTVKLTQLDITFDYGDVYFEDGNVNEPEITLPVPSPIVPHNLKITKTDDRDVAIENNSALFKVVDLNGATKYVETEENGSITLSDLVMPETEGPFVYTIQEIVAPTGYVVAREAMELTVEFDELGNITSAIFGDEEANIVADTNTIEISIKNEAEIIKPEQEIFNLVLNKVDEQGVSITTDTAEFTLNLPDGTQTNYETELNTGKTEKISILAPESAGKYAYVIKETKSPNGYVVDPYNIIVELVFEEQENKIVLTSANIVSYNNENVVPVTEGDEKTLTIDIKNEQEVITYDYSINIDKVKNDTFKTNITEDKAIFEIIENGKTTYISTNVLGKAIYEFSKTNKEIAEQNEYTYTVKEIKAPEGYVLDESEKTITITFDTDGSISEMNVLGNNIEKITSTSSEANVKIVNEEEPEEVVLVPENFGLVINKVDELGNLITTDSAEFILTMPDGTRQNCTTTNGVITGINLTAPKVAEKQVYFLQEVKAPEGYTILKDSLVIEMNYVESEGKIVLNNAIIKDYNNQEVVPVVSNTTKTLTINVVNEKIKTFNIELSGINRDNEPITSGTTVIKITNTETQEYFYEEVTIVNGKVELNMPEVEGIATYEIEQIKAPEGYELNENKITIQIEFSENDEGTLELKDYTVQGTDAKKGNSTEKNTASVIIINDEIVVEPQKENYSMEINKLDAQTNDLITESPAVFTVISADAKINDYPTTNGKVLIEGIIPGGAGEEYIYVIKEKTAPVGYQVSEKSVVIKCAFEEKDGIVVIANVEILLGADIATAQLDGTTVKVNVVNEKEEDEDLYVVSKKDREGIDIYNLFNSYSGKHYSIENPFIDTKIAKYGNNCTVQEFINNLDSNGVLTVWDLEGNQIPSTGRVKTKMILKATKGEQELTFTIVVKGDSDGDGRVRTVDLNILIKHMSNEEVLTSPIELRALDLTEDYGDGIIRTTDLNMMYQVMAQ